MPCFWLFFQGQTPAVQREIRSFITMSPATAIIPGLGVSPEQIATALTLSDKLPKRVQESLTEPQHSVGRSQRHSICF